MSWLRSIFGPSKHEIWSQIATEIGGEYVDGGFWKSGVLRFQHGEWELLLDTYAVSSGNNQTTTYTRMRAPFINKDGLYFKIHREGVFSGMGKFFGMQDLTIGDAYFDDSFVIKGNDPQKLKCLLADHQLKQLIDVQPRIALEIRDDEGWFGKQFPEGVDQLCFTCVGVMKDKKHLKALFYLFSLLLERLVQIDSAYENDPGIRL